MCLAQEMSNDRYIYCFQGALSLGEKTDIFAINITEWEDYRVNKRYGGGGTKEKRENCLGRREAGKDFLEEITTA